MILDISVFTLNLDVSTQHLMATVVTKVLHIKDTYRRYVGVDASAVNLLRPAMARCLPPSPSMTNPDGDIQ